VEVIEIAYKYIITIFVERCVFAEDKAYTTLMPVLSSQIADSSGTDITFAGLLNKIQSFVDLRHKL
jgi:hypothetical protein